MILTCARNLSLLAVLATATGCGSGEPGLAEPDWCVGPEILAGSVAPNPNNVLSALVAARLLRADSVEVTFGLAGGDLDSVTPAAAVAGDSVSIPVLGLLPETAYALRLAARNRCGIAAGPALSLTTGALPDDLPRYQAGGSAPSGGFVVFAAAAYGLVIDNTGRVVWYHRFPRGPGLNFQAQPNGRYVARPPPSSTNAIVSWVEVDPLGTVTRSLTCARGLQPRFHDLIALPDGSYWLMCDETRVMDLSDFGGQPSALVTGTVVQHLSAAGGLLFEWSPFDHFAITDLEAQDRAGPSVNWTHGNSLDLDADGNLLLSFRNLSEITKINVSTGAVVWRMGGPANQFTFLDSPAPPYLRQHGLRAEGPGRFALLDNLGESAGSRARRYQIDETLKTARLAATYSSSPEIVGQLGGSTQSLRLGRILVAYGNGGRVEEYDAAGNVVWRIEGNPGYVFRAQRISSLYRPGAGTPR
jgi:hypothetical protein